MHTSVFPRWAGDSTPPFVLNQCELMATKGWEVTVLAPHSRGAKLSEGIKGVRVIRYPYMLPFQFEQLCYNGGILINLQKKPLLRCLLPFFFLSQLLALLYVCIREKPTLLHSHSLLPQGLSAAWVGRLLRIPHVTTSHGNDVFGLPTSGWMGRLKRSVLKQANAITVNSSATQAAVMALGASAEKVHLIPAVANVGKIDPDIVQSIEVKYGKSPKVLFVGRFIEEKGVLDLLQAFAQVKERVDDVQCLFVGDGVLRAEMKAMARALKIEQAVHLIGWRPGEEIASWMAAADVLIVPSKPVGTWQEAQGLVVVEAMSVGTPVIASHIGGIPDMVKDGETGRLFTPGDPGQLAELLVDLFANHGDYERMTKAARARVAEHYAADAVARQTEELYQRCVKH